MENVYSSDSSDTAQTRRGIECIACFICRGSLQATPAICHSLITESPSPHKLRLIASTSTQKIRSNGHNYHTDMTFLQGQPERIGLYDNGISSPQGLSWPFLQLLKRLKEMSSTLNPVCQTNEPKSRSLRSTPECIAFSSCPRECGGSSTLPVCDGDFHFIVCTGIPAVARRSESIYIACTNVHPLHFSQLSLLAFELSSITQNRCTSTFRLP
ncbi:hypothetical protein K474DRAFT_1527249 [Panus rudis PR-1116 ss-1]|nr:hypothetical protein K474DRAFT_1527249 [Panus rudis PR-1116 ss-1]